MVLDDNPVWSFEVEGVTFFRRWTRDSASKVRVRVRVRMLGHSCCSFLKTSARPTVYDRCQGGPWARVELVGHLFGNITIGEVGRYCTVTHSPTGDRVLGCNKLDDVLQSASKNAERV